MVLCERSNNAKYGTHVHDIAYFKPNIFYERKLIHFIFNIPNFKTLHSICKVDLRLSVGMHTGTVLFFPRTGVLVFLCDF